MNHLSTQSPYSTPQSPNRQEISYYFFFAAAFLLGTIMLALLAWTILPRMQQTLIGDMGDFPPATIPYRVKNFWVVNTGGELLVFDNLTPPSGFRRCTVAWTPANGRFEDPCGGSKFTLIGDYIEGTAVRSLDRYPVTMRRGRLFIDEEKLILGESSPAAVP